MFEGGVSFSKGSDRAVRLVGLIGTPIFVGYNMLVFFGVVPSQNYLGDDICLAVSALWILVGIYHYFVPIKSRLDLLIRLFLYHGLALATVMFITGFFQPFASSLALLFLASNVYFGRKGLIFSLSSVTTAVVVDTIARLSVNPDILVYNFLGFVGILVLGVSMIAIIMSQETRRLALIESQAKERLQYDRTTTIINNLADATFATDNEGTIKLFNAASLELIDTNENIDGLSIDQILKLSDEEGKSVKLATLLDKATRAVRTDNLRHTYKDGEQIRLEITYAPIKGTYHRHQKDREDTDTGYIIIIRDVTKSKSLEEERDEFISVVSHELRTPITIMEGTLSNLTLMMEKKDAANHKTQTEAVNMAHEQSLYLAKMVNDLSTLSRAERGAADLAEEIEVDSLVHKLYDEYHDEAKEKGLKLNLDLYPKLGSILVSRLYIEELLQNFITNSMKYTKKGRIDVIVKKSNNKVTFSVKDTGIGISRGDQQKIFNKFYRSEDYRIRETSGTGLGLYVSAKLASKLGTKVKLTSRLNHGSTFSFTLPSIDSKKK